MGKMLSPVLARLDAADFYDYPVLCHWCPACEELHALSCEKAPPNGQLFVWDGEINFPTFWPAMRIQIGPFTRRDRKPDWVCHYFLRQGILTYLNDCTHPLVGEKRGLIPIPEHRKQRIEANEQARGARDG